MGWFFRKRFRKGPVTTTISKKGIGFSWGISGFRIGVSPDGKKFFSIGIPGTGLYYIKYFSPNNKASNTTGKPEETKSKSNNEQNWWNQEYFKDLQ